MPSLVGLVSGQSIARYGFGEGHPLGPDRHDAFMAEVRRRGLDSVLLHLDPHPATQEELEAFHTPEYIEMVRRRSQTGGGFLDGGDTPAFPGVFEAAAGVAGATLVALEAVLSEKCRRAFVPVAGLHHAGRAHAAGFCVFNDCGIAAEILRRRYGLRRIAYVDIDAHHGDGVFYAFEDDPEFFFADIHEDGRYLYPGTGAASETGTGRAVGTKLNLPVLPGAADREFHKAWAAVEDYLAALRPEFILFQCGADSLAGDPITHLRYTAAAHGHAARRLCELAEEFGHGRVLGMGGGGYNKTNIAMAWTAVIESFLRVD
jgi:acetoin utilization protein AcuC